MVELLICLTPVALAFGWRLSYDAGRRWGTARNLLTIDGTQHALLIDNRTLHMMRDLRPNLERDGWQQRDLFAEDRSVFAAPTDYLWRMNTNVSA